MKKHFYLMPVLALSMTAFALTACDDKKEDAAAPDAPLESSMPAAQVPAGEDTPAPAETEAATTQAPDEPVVQAASPVTVMDAHAYATAPSAETGAIFAKITNNSATPDLLIQAKTDVSNKSEIHEIAQDPQTGATMMRRTSGIDIPANGGVTLAPDSYHIMLMGLKAPLTGGQTFDVRLIFRDAGEVVVPVTVVTVGAAEAAEHDHSTHEGHGGADDAGMSEDAAETMPAGEAPADDAAAQ